jgi:glycosyltransferase involved in cell wall biosynthesis
MNNKVYRLICLGNGYLTGLGGGLVRTLALVRYLNENNNSKIIIHCSPGVEKYLSNVSLTSTEVIVHKFFFSKFIPTKFIYTSLLVYYTEVFLFFPRIKSNNNEIIYSQTEYLWDIVSALRISCLKSKYICMFHHIIDKNNVKSLSILASFISQKISIYVLKKGFDQINIYNTHSGDRVYEIFKGITSLSFKRVNNGIWLSNINKVLADRSTSAESNVDILFIGGIRPQKGLEIIDDFLQSYINIDPNINILLIGSTPSPIANRLLRKYSNNLNIIKGLSQIEVYNKISQAKICFSPSQTEGFGIAILEALAMEKKVVCLPLPVLKGIYSDFIYYSENMTGKSLALKCHQILNSHEVTINKINLKNFINKYDWQIIFNDELKHD